VKRILVLIVLLVPVLLGSIATGTRAADEDLPATVEALQTRVADLEGAVSDLQTRVAAPRTAETPHATASAKPSPTRTPEAPSAATGDGSSRNSPLPVGTAAAIGDYEISVVETNFDAEAEILAKNRFNDPARPGNVMIMTTLDVTYTGNATGNIAFDVSYDVVGSRGLAYTTYDEKSSCGVIPNGPYEAPEMYPGASLSLNICWQVPEDEVDSLVMVLEPLFSFDDSDRVFYSLGSADSGASTESIDAGELPTTVDLEMVDLAFNPDELTIPANTDVTFNLANEGALPHSFTIENTDIPTAKFQAGESDTVTVNLEPGTYRIVCDVPGHEDAGQIAILTVK
jgi:uncharacterized cupredoxin-like copper-binding protein